MAIDGDIIGFEATAHSNGDTTWSAREFATFLGYADYQSFAKGPIHVENQLDRAARLPPQSRSTDARSALLVDEGQGQERALAERLEYQRESPTRGAHMASNVHRGRLPRDDVRHHAAHARQLLPEQQPRPEVHARVAGRLLLDHGHRQRRPRPRASPRPAQVGHAHRRRLQLRRPRAPHELRDQHHEDDYPHHAVIVASPICASARRSATRRSVVASMCQVSSGCEASAGRRVA